MPRPPHQEACSSVVTPIGAPTIAARDICGVAVARLHAVVVVPRRHEDDRLAVRGLEHAHDVRRDERATRKDAEVDRLEVGEQGVVALDRHHRLPGRGAVAVVERVHRELVPVVRAELEDRDRLVHPAEIRVPLLEHLHHDARPASVVQQRCPRMVEVRVGVVALAHLLDGQVEDSRAEAARAIRSWMATLFLLELEARGERGLGDFDLLRRRLCGRDAMLELVAGLGERAREPVLRVAHHPAEDLGGSGQRAALRARAARACGRGRAHAPPARCRSRSSRARGRSGAIRSGSCSFVARSPCS